MKRILLAGAAVLALTAAQPTIAADAPVYKGPAPVAAALFNWSGLYIGINGGYSWGRGSFEFDPAGGVPGAFNVSGALIGGTLGWNTQAPGSNIVWGIEGDLDWTNISGSGLCPNPAFTCGVANSWLGTIRGRVGVAANTILFYVTGGVAFGDVKAQIPTGPTAFPGQSTTNVGWTAGVGVEAAVGGNLSVKAEYLYVDLGSASCAIPNCSALGTATVSLRPSIFRVGANWRW